MNKKGLPVLAMWIVLPLVAMLCAFEFAESRSSTVKSSDTIAANTDQQFNTMSQSEHLARAKELCGQYSTIQQLYEARQHLISISVKSPEYQEAVALKSQVEQKINGLSHKNN